MAQCAACRAEIPVYERRCQSCGAGVVRDANSLLANAPTDKELSQARLGHLLALPGMLIMAIYFGMAPEKFALWALLPLNLLIPFLYWLLHLESPFVRSHGAEVFNFQLLWTPVTYAVWFVPFGVGLVSGFVWMLAHAVILAGGIGLVWVASNDAASVGDGKYPVRLPLFR